MLSISCYLSLTLWLLGGSPAPTPGAEPAAAEVQEKIVVTASRTAEKANEVPATVHVIQRDQLVKRAGPGASLGWVLGQLAPGFGVGTGIRTNFTQNLRGRDVLVLIDGVPQNDNRAINRQLDAIHIDHVARVEIVSGAGAVHGAGGSGGVINIMTRQPNPGKLRHRINLGAVFSEASFDGDSARTRASYGLDGRIGAWDLLVSAGYEKRGNFFDADGGQIAPEPAQTSLGDTEQRDVMFKTGVQISSGRRLDIQAQVYQDKQDTNFAPNYGGPGVPALLGQAASNSAVAGLELERQPKTERNAFSLTYTDADILGQAVTAQLYYRDRTFRFFPFPLPVPGVNPTGFVVNQSTSEAALLGSKLTATSILNPRHQITWGLDYRLDRGQQSATTYDPVAFVGSGGLNYQPQNTHYSYGPDVDTAQTGVFGLWKYSPSSRLGLRLGLRYEDIQVTVDPSVPYLEALAFDAGLSPLATPLAGADLNYDTLLINGGINYRIHDFNTLYLSYSEGFDLPDTARLLRNALAPDSLLVLAGGFPGGTLIADSELEAVKVQHLETGWRLNADKAFGSVVLFYNQSGKTPVFNRDYTVTILDQDKRIYGYELTAGYHVSERLNLEAAYHRHYGEHREDDTWRALSAAEVAPPKLTASLSYRLPEIGSAGLGLTRVSDDDAAFKDDPAQAAIQGYSLVDAWVQAPFSRFEVRLNLGNLFNTDYQSVYAQWGQNIYGPIAGIRGEGRSIGLSFSADF